jgi:hypothetical protein
MSFDLEKTKEEMKKFRDAFGQPLIWSDEIDSCRHVIDCDAIIERHREHLIDTVSDAEKHLDNFKRRIGIS